MKKKILMLGLAGLLAISFTACSNDKSQDQPSEPATEQTTEQSTEQTSDQATAAGLAVTSLSDVQQITAPEGFSLNVTVNDPSLVKSYQWQIARADILDDDGEFVDYDWYDLNGTSASTDTLIKPSTDAMTPSGIYRCMITDVDGEVIYTDITGYEISNYDATLTFAQLGELALRAGETIDLADTPYGSGTISLNETGDVCTITDLVFDNTNAVYDLDLGCQGFCFCDRNTSIETFTLEVQGDCSIINTLWQEDYNSAGLAVLFNYYGSDSALTTTKITGDGSLSIKGGQALIYSDVDIEVDCDLIFDSFEDHFTDGIRVKGGAYVHDCSIKSDKLNGRVIFAGTGETRIENCVISAEVNVPAVSQGSANYHGISGANGLTISNSEINIKGSVDADWLPYGTGQIIGIYSETTADITNSDVRVYFAAKGESEYLYNLTLLLVGEDLNLDNSNLDLAGDAAIVYNGAGINCTNLNAVDSMINVDLVASGNVYGIADRGTSNYQNSRLYLKAVAGGMSDDDQVFGLMVYDIAMEGSDSVVEINTFDEVAFGIYLGYGDEEHGYNDKYEATGALDKFVLPGGTSVNQYTIGTGSDFTYIETIYEQGSKYHPVSSLTLKAK